MIFCSGCWLINDNSFVLFDYSMCTRHHWGIGHTPCLIWLIMSIRTAIICGNRICQAILVLKFSFCFRPTLFGTINNGLSFGGCHTYEMLLLLSLCCCFCWVWKITNKKWWSHKILKFFPVFQDPRSINLNKIRLSRIKPRVEAERLARIESESSDQSNNCSQDYVCKHTQCGWERESLTGSGKPKKIWLLLLLLWRWCWLPPTSESPKFRIESFDKI